MQSKDLIGVQSPGLAGAPVPFDVLRALIAARQSASPTARLIAARRNSEPQPDHLNQLIDLFARGQRLNNDIGSFASAQPSDPQDQQHG
jgi:hypothetical protein